MHLEGTTVRRRRRGAELESAILGATWAELVEHGYADLTLEAVADRAETSRTVLHRRWQSKADLVRAAVVRQWSQDRPPLPDTGSLRDDMVALLRQSNRLKVAASALLTYYLGPYFHETGTSPSDLRALLIAGRATSVDLVIDRAVERGEVDPRALTPRRRAVAFDLFRHEALMTLAPVSDEAIAEIVDDIFMPLVSG